MYADLVTQQTGLQAMSMSLTQQAVIGHFKLPGKSGE